MATTKKAVKKTTKTPAVKVRPAAKKAVTQVENLTAVKAVRKKGVITAEVLDLSGKVVENMSLPEVLFGAQINRPLMAQAVRVYLANQRGGNASTKTRGEVTGSTRKIYRQKGTGRARHGGARAPIFVHGGVAHGPKPTDFSLTMPQKMRQKALFSALSAKVNDKELKVLSGFEVMAPKTKNFAAFLKTAALDKKKSVLLVVPDTKGSFVKAVRNIQGLSYISATQLNTYEVLKNQAVLVMKDAVSAMEKHYSKEAKNV